jgi:hypothetical protein
MVVVVAGAVVVGVGPVVVGVVVVVGAVVVRPAVVVVDAAAAVVEGDADPPQAAAVNNSTAKRERSLAAGRAIPGSVWVSGLPSRKPARVPSARLARK